MTGMQPIYEITSHIAGKNAQVRIWPDRLEWSRKGLMSTGAKAGVAVATAGLSYLATGIRGKREGETIPIRSISHVQRGNSRLQDKVIVKSSAGDVEMRVSRSEADQLISILNALINGTHPSVQTAQTQAPASAQQSQPTMPDVSAQLQQLAGLRDAGILTEAEFEAKKAEILARM
ncbi:SHOCT domain-containing protein [Leucobacter massiliensis]|uniref:SHOCT domain-containing protein n=1 Tax=Leucobacter massiliensis TaxID=1686285 RepID=A0A2S9QMY9_9MICO|nr:SHOCT domain-containing protein [Leucobacter massiliensis]PRI10958.1 hypothetical protein B4915_08725 [Leucobacter massiliensis]